MSSLMEAITVVSKDDVELKMTIGAAIQSRLLNHMIGDVSIPTDCKSPNKLSEVNSEILGKVIEYCEKHAKGNDGASDSDAEELKKWDEEFMKVGEATLLHILMAAHYLGIEGLFDLARRTVACVMKGKTLKEIRKMFNIENDFTPEEQDRLRRQNPNCSFD